MFNYIGIHIDIAEYYPYDIPSKINFSFARPATEKRTTATRTGNINPFEQIKDSTSFGTMTERGI